MTDEHLQRIGRIVGRRALEAEPLAGGAIGVVERVRLGDGTTLVAKRSPGTPLTVEASMLRYLAELAVLPVPGVLHASDELLLLEDLPGASDHDADAARHLGELVAELHGLSAPSFGFHADTLLGPYRLDNRPSDDWPTYFLSRRLTPMHALAVASGHLDAETAERIARLEPAIDDALGHQPDPAPIHGDLWATNVLSERGRVTGVLDPAVSWSDPEVDIAYLDLFGGFHAATLEAYQRKRPLPDAYWEVRRPIYELLPLLVHVAHFGQRYLPALRRTIARVERAV